MFIGTEQYQATVSRMVAEEKQLYVAVAFWGEGAVSYIHPDISKPIHIICNLKSGGTNPYVIEKLVERAATHSHIKVKQCDRLHAKIIVGDSSALVGSANFSANGLGLEGKELAHWLEAAMFTVEPKAVQSANSWFKELWNSPSTREITAEDLALAKVVHAENRDKRYDRTGRGTFSFKDYEPHDLHDRNAYALIYRDTTGPEAEAAAEQYQRDEILSLGGNPSKRSSINQTMFECWPESLDTSDTNEYLGLLWKLNGRLEVDGACRMTGTRVEFTYADTGKQGWVDLANPSKTLLRHRLNKTDCKALSKEVQVHMSRIWNEAKLLDPNEPDARLIHLSEIARILKE